MHQTNGVLHKYWSWMPAELQWIPKDRIVTLGEGDTPLWRAKGLESYLKELSNEFCAKVWLKLEGENRGSKSFKDRGMTAAVTKALADGIESIICASTGNTAAAAAVYAKAAGLKCFVVLPEGNVAPGKLMQAYLHGATVIGVKCNFDAALKIVKELKEIQMVNSLNPYRIHGQKTAAFETVDQLERAPLYHFLPVGNGCNIAAYWLGYKEYFAGKCDWHVERISHSRISRLPRMVGFQAAGAAPIVLGRVVKNPKTIASAISIGNPAKWTEALAAIEESRGFIGAVTDAEIMAAYELIPKLEPLFCEPSSATPVAGLVKLVSNLNISNCHKNLRYLWSDGDIVITLTGSGFKDMDTAKKIFVKNPIVVEPTFDAVMNVIQKS